MNNFNTRNNSGSILMITILILSGIIIVVLGAAGLIFSGLKMSGTQEISTKAYFIAEAGIEKYLYFEKITGKICGIGEFIDFASEECSGIEYKEFFGEGAFVVQQKSATQIISTGEYRDVKRVVEVVL